MAFELNYTAVPTFQQIHLDENPYIFVMGPVGSGKSSGAVWHCFLNALKQQPQFDGVRRSKYGIIRATYPALKSTVIKTWTTWFKSLINVVYDVPIRGMIKVPHPDGKTSVEMEIVFIALDREEDVNKLQSLELTAVHINEAAEIPRGIHQFLKSRYKRFPLEGGLRPVDPFIICDYNAVSTDHWLYKISEEEKPPRHSFYKQPPALFRVQPGETDIVDIAGNSYKVNWDADNIMVVGGDYYEEMVYGADPEWVNVLVLNNYGMVRHGRPVYPEYIDSIHYDEKLLEPMQGIPILVGMDLGLTPAAALAQLTPSGGLNVFDEIVTEDCSIQSFCEDLLKPHMARNYPKCSYELIVDPAALTRSQNDAKAAAEVIRDCGLNFRLGATNNQLKRKESMVYFLRKINGFKIGPKALHLRKGFISEFKYEKKRSAMMQVVESDVGLFKEKWEKNLYSHVHEALQYTALEATEGRASKRRRKAVPSAHNVPADSAAGY
jgi:hypothetical protein